MIYLVFSFVPYQSIIDAFNLKAHASSYVIRLNSGPESLPFFALPCPLSLSLSQLRGTHNYPSAAVVVVQTHTFRYTYVRTYTQRGSKAEWRGRSELRMGLSVPQTLGFRI